MLVIEGQPVVIPDQIGCALITALHASKATSLDKAVEDLRRALRLFDDEVWRQAAGLARSVGAANAFAAALYRHSAGAELAARLGLAVTDPVVWFRATSAGRGAGALCVVLEADGWAARARRLRNAVFPSRACLAGSRPIANRGLGGLGVAHACRLSVIATRLPGVLLAWHAASCAVDRTGGSAPRARAPRRTGRPVRARTAGFAATGWWTLRTWWRVHRWLARGPGESGSPPVTVVPVGGGAAYSRRAAQLVLASCRATCLEIAHVRQARAAAAGLAVDVIVGVTAPASGFRAHAWLDGDRVDPGFAELCRYPAAQAEPGQCPRTG
jgi:Transglutaminase-like superfamily